MSVTRFGVSLEEVTLEALDQYVVENNFANRSRALRFLIERHIVEKKWRCDNMVAGVITLVYSINNAELPGQIILIENAYQEQILSSQRYRLTMENQMQVLVIRGTSRILTALSEKLFCLKGLQHGKLTMSKV